MENSNSNLCPDCFREWGREWRVIYHPHPQTVSMREKEKEREKDDERAAKSSFIQRPPIAWYRRLVYPFDVAQTTGRAVVRSGGPRSVVGHHERMLAMLLGEKRWIGVFGEDEVGGEGVFNSETWGCSLSPTRPRVRFPNPCGEHPAGTAVEGWLACRVSVEVAADTCVTPREGWGTNVSRLGKGQPGYSGSVRVGT